MRALEPGIADIRMVWLRAYIAAARGRFSRAERLARRVLTSRPDPETRARAVATLGSVLRQTGRHAEARRIERAALRRAPGGELRAHLMIGLAADAVGLGDLAAVDTTLSRVGRSDGQWRVRVRRRWVRCERELLAGRPLIAARHAREAAAIAAQHRARRHEAKSHLFLGAALLDAAARKDGGRDVRRDAARHLRRAQVIATGIGARPIASVARSLLDSSAAPADRISRA